MRYSTARSGLLKLALSARMTCSLGNPIESISFTAVSICEPVTKLDAPSARLAADSAVAAGVESGADEVAGALSVGAEADTAGVSLAEEAASGAGADTLASGAEDEAAGAGAAFGCDNVSLQPIRWSDANL